MLVCRYLIVGVDYSWVGYVWFVCPVLFARLFDDSVVLLTGNLLFHCFLLGCLFCGFSLYVV